MEVSSRVAIAKGSDGGETEGLIAFAFSSRPFFIRGYRCTVTVCTGSRQSIFPKWKLTQQTSYINGILNIRVRCIWQWGICNELAEKMQ